MTTPELADGAIVDGRYRIERRLGRGGMGSVYEAQQIKLQRLVALKVLRPEFAEQELAVRRFEREAKAASAIDHRNVVKILDFGQLDSGECYYTMELLKGRDLAQLLRAEGVLPWSRAGWILLQLVRAFAAVHAQGVIHRDIKPANCFLLDPKPGDEPDLVKILDFGIANVQEAKGATVLTGAYDIIGTALYMAPEQALSGHVDARTDIYAFGVMMYELLTGVVPFPGDNPFAVMTAHQREQPVSPRLRQPSIPPQVEAIILTCLAKDPAARFASMLDVELAMVPYVGTSVGAGTVPVVTPAGDSGRSPQTDRYGQAPAPATPGSWAYAPPPSTGVASPGSAITLGKPRSRSSLQRWLAGLLMLALALLGAAGVVLWAQQRKPATATQTPPPKPPQAETVEPAPPRNASAEPLRVAPPPPEKQYDPFADPFGAPVPALRMLAVKERGEPDAAGAEDPEHVPEAVDLEALLPPEPWTAEVGSIAGRVENERGRALEGAGVCAWLVDPRAPMELRRKPKCARTDKRGRFRMSEVPPSLYDLSTFAEGYLPQSLGQATESQLLVVRPGETRSGVAFVLAPGGGAVTGKVRGSEGEPIPGARVAALGRGRALAVADAQGEFSLWLEPGEVSLVAWASGYTDVVRHGPADRPFDLELRREAMLMGKVVWEDTREPVESARVRAGSRAGVDPVVYTDAQGLFSIPALTAGSYRPVARTDTGYAEGDPVQLEEGTISPEVVLEARRVEPQAVAPPAEVPPSEPPLPEPAVETAVEAAPDKPLTDADVRRKLARRIRKCGDEGTVELRAKYILESGTLFLPEARVQGGAGPDVKACAEAAAAKAEFKARKQPALFPVLRIEF